MAFVEALAKVGHRVSHGQHDSGRHRPGPHAPRRLRRRRVHGHRAQPGRSCRARRARGRCVFQRGQGSRRGRPRSASTPRSTPRGAARRSRGRGRPRLHPQRHARRGRPRCPRASTWCARSPSRSRRSMPCRSSTSPPSAASSPPCRSSTGSTRWPVRPVLASPPATPVGCPSSTAPTSRTGSRPRTTTAGGSTRAGGPSRAFADIGSHLVDLLEFVPGARIVRLTPRPAPFTSSAPSRHRHRRHRGLIVEATAGAVGTLVVCQVAPGRKNALAIEVSGIDASLRFEQERPERLWVGRAESATIVDRDVARLAPGAARLALVPAGHPKGYQDASPRSSPTPPPRSAGRRPTACRFDDGLRAVRVTEAVVASAASGRLGGCGR